MLEEAVGGVTQARNVWSPVYVNALVLRDQSSQHNGVLDQRLYVQQDANWNVTALVDTSGNVVERYDYTPFGVQTVLAPDWSVRSSSVYAVPYGFQGMRADLLVGLQFADNRVYSPTLMRWLQTDPLGLNAGNNDYAFAGNGPTDGLDPSGLWNLWNPGTWGYGNGPGEGVGNSLNPFGSSAHWGAAVEGANYGSAVMLNKMSFGYMPGAQRYIDKHQGEFNPETTAIVEGMGTVARELLLLALTMGAGNVIQAGRVAGYSVWTVRTSRGVQMVFTVRAGYQTYQGMKETWAAYQKGDTRGVLINGTCTLLSLLSSISGTRSLLTRPGKLSVITAGQARVAKFGHLWQKASLRKAIERHAGSKATSWRTATGKTIYENPVTGRQVIVDDAGYFRIFQPKTIGSKDGHYLDMLGKIPSPARRVKGGAIKNVPLEGDDLNSYTHFLIE